MTAGRVGKRKSTKVDVPSLQQDATERKRVLNVLAQRRYRERRREKLEMLEAQVNGTTKRNSEAPTAAEFEGLEALPDVLPATQLQPIDRGFDDEFLLNDGLQEYAIAPDTSSILSKYPSSISDSTSYPSTSTLPLSPALNDPWKFGSSTTSSESYSFPDEILLPVYELNLLRAGMAIATRINVDSIIWEFGSLSPFAQASGVDYSHLPHNLQPTLLQLTIPHHPSLDIIPWPTVRDRFIRVMLQPEHLRPPAAKSSLALIDFFYDMEDSSEGVRITGSNPCAAENWEVGQQLFEKWWWLFSRDIIDNSNRMRLERGSTELGGRVVGEVS